MDYIAYVKKNPQANKQECQSLFSQLSKAGEFAVFLLKICAKAAILSWF